MIRYKSRSTPLGRKARRRVLHGACVALLLSACGGPQAPPGPGYERGMVPDLGGTTVMVLPVQVRSGVHADLDREIAFALTGGDRRESWAMPDDLREMLARNPGERIPIDNLPVSVFRAGEVERIGDPLFGYLYRLGILADAGLALIPVEAVSHGDGQGEARVHLSAALVDTRGGWVRWFGVVEGEMGSPGDLAPAATAADALARRVAR